jgi:alpha-L-rhamnosidase
MITKTITPVKLTNPKAGVYIYDMVQNFSGRIKLAVKGKRGTTVKLRYAEVLDEYSMLNLKPIRGAKVTDTYILKGKGIEVYEPHFTYHGFRFVELTGFPGKPSRDSILGLVLHSDVKPAGSFNCSNQLFNKIHRLVRWGQLSNLMSVPTDCNQRDERMGWTGDAQLTVEEAIYNFDMAGFYSKWARDLALAQHKDGCVPDVVPEYWDFLKQDPAWGTVYITTVWHLYLYYADKMILAENYTGLKKWIKYLGSKSEKYVVTHGAYGDWCAPMQISPVSTPKELTSTFQYYKDSMWLSKIARILDKSKDARKYSALAEKVKTAFNKKFLKKDRYTATGNSTYSQTSNILPLALDMAPEDAKEKVVNNLVGNIVDTYDNHLNTGIIGTRYAMGVLSAVNRNDIAYRILNQTTYPSFGYMIKEGATTVWERWERLASGGMCSHNHIMFGTPDVWFYNVLAGINLDKNGPGFRRLIIKPRFINRLDYVNASVNTLRGAISSSWKKAAKTVALQVIIPVNSTAKLILSEDKSMKIIIKEGNKIIWKNNKFTNGRAGITSGKKENGSVIFNIGSGLYNFTINGAAIIQAD